MKPYLRKQALIFMAVNGLLWYFPWRYLGGVDWAFTLAYGALLVLPMWIHKARFKSWAPIVVVAFIWSVGVYVRLKMPGFEVLAKTEATLYTICFVVCAMCWRGWMAVWSIPILLYTVRLTGIEDPTYNQEGLHNVLFACLALTAGREIEKDRQRGTVKETPISEEYGREAA